MECAIIWQQTDAAVAYTDAFCFWYTNEYPAFSP